MCVQDAVALRKIFTARKHELEQSTKVATTPAPARSQRVRTRGAAVNSAATDSSQSLCATIAALRGESEDEDNEQNEGVDEAESELAMA